MRDELEVEGLRSRVFTRDELWIFSALAGKDLELGSLIDGLVEDDQDPALWRTILFKAALTMITPNTSYPDDATVTVLTWHKKKMSKSVFAKNMWIAVGKLLTETEASEIIPNQNVDVFLVAPSNDGENFSIKEPPQLSLPLEVEPALDLAAIYMHLYNLADSIKV